MPRRDPNRFFDVEDVHSSLGRRSARGGTLAVAGQSTRFALQTGFQILMPRLLVPEDFGIVAMVTAVSNIIMFSRDMGLTYPTVQRKTITHQQVSNLFWSNAAFITLVCGLLMLAAPFLANFYDQPEVRLVTIWIAISWLPFGFMAQHQAILTRRMQFGRIVTVEVTALALAVTAGLVAAFQGAGYWALVIFYNVNTFLTAIGLILMCRWVPGLPRRTGDTRSLVGFGVNITVFNLVNGFSRTFDQLLIGRVFGATTLGFYERAYRIVTLPMTQINTPAMTVAVPALSRLQEQPRRYREYYIRIITMIGLVTLPAVATAMILIQDLLHLVWGPGWSRAGELFTILGFGALFAPFINSVGWLFTSQDRSRELLWGGVVSSLTLVVSAFAGLPWGVNGIAWGVTLGTIGLRMPILFWVVGRKGPVKTGQLYRLLPLPLIVAALVALVVTFVHRVLPPVSPLADVLILAAVAIATDILVLLILPQGRQALHMARDILRKAVHG